jgi:hypothetical protein
VGCCYWVGSKKQQLRVEALLLKKNQSGLKKQKKTANSGHHCG